MFAQVWETDDKLDLLLASVAATSLAYGIVFLSAALAYNHKRFAGLWGGLARRSPLARQVLFVIIFGGAFLILLMEAVWVAIGFTNMTFALRSLLSLFPGFGIGVAAAWLMPTTPVASAHAV